MKARKFVEKYNWNRIDWNRIVNEFERVLEEIIRSG